MSKETEVSWPIVNAVWVESEDGGYWAIEYEIEYPIIKEEIGLDL